MPPGFELRTFLVTLLQDREPGLAAKIARLDREEFHALAQEIAECQDFVR